MNVLIKKMETDSEIRGKAYVHFRSWHEAYRGLVDPVYLDKLTLAKCEEIAFRLRENLLVALDGKTVVGFAGYGNCTDDDLSEAGELFALYVLPEYYGTGLGRLLTNEALSRLSQPKVCLWVLKDNLRAIRFYEKYGFRADGREKTLTLGTPVQVIRMIISH